MYKNLQRTLRGVIGMTLLTVSSLLSVAQQQTLENNQLCMDPIVGRGAFINGANTGLCVLCSSAGSANVINGNLKDSVTLTAVANVAGALSVSVKDSLQYYPGGNVVGFVIKPNASLLTTNILNFFQIRTYRNGVQQETATLGNGFLTATALGAASKKQALSFKTTKDFDEVQLYAGNGLANVLTSVVVYYAFEGPSSCPTDCVNALTGTEINGSPTSDVINTGNVSVCLGSITNVPRVADADTTNFASVNVLVGVNCEYYIDVPLASSYLANLHEVGFVVNNGGGLLDATVLAGLKVSTFLGSSPQQSFTGTNLVATNLLNGTNLSQVGFKATQPFDRVRISAIGLASVAYNLQVYYAYLKTDTDADGVLDCMEKCPGNDDLLDTDGDGIPNPCDNNLTDLSLTKTANLDSVAVGGNVTFTVTANRIAGSESPTGLVIKDLLPVGLTFVSATPPTGTFYNQATGIWNVGSALSGPTTSLSLVIVAKADSNGVLSNTAEITSVVELDPDSQAGNGNLTEDDIASDCVSVPFLLCPGQSVLLTAPAGSATYQWFRNGTAIPNATLSTYTVTTSGKYTFSTSLASGCPSGNCCPVIVNYVNLVANAGADPAPVCAGTPVTLIGTGGGTYLWSTGANTSSITVSPTTTQAYILTVSNGSCSAKDTVVVTVRPRPTTTGAVAICNNAGTTATNADDTFTFTLNPAGGTTTYTVSGAVVGNGTYGTPSGPYGPFLISSGPKSITITDANGCTLTATINPPATCSACPVIPVCVPVTAQRVR